MKSLTLTKLNRWLLCGILFSLPFERIPSLSIGPSGLTIRTSQVLALILITLNLPLVWKRRKALVTGPWVWLVAFNLLSFVSAFLSDHRGPSVKTAIFVAFVSAISFVVAQVFERQDIKQYAIWGLIGVIVSCVFGIYQFFGDLAGLPGWATGLRDQYMKGGIFPFPRIESTALEPLYFANYLLVPLSLILLVQVFIKRWAWIIALPILTIIILSLSRGAQFAAACVVVGVIGVAFLTKHYRRGVEVAATSAGAVALALSLIAFGSYLYPQYHGGKNTAKDSVKSFTNQSTNVSQGESAEGRALGRKIAFNEAKSNPVLGIGPGNYGYYAHAQHPLEFGTDDTIVNNETLEIAAEEGFVGLALMIGFVAAVLLRTIRCLRTTRDSVVKLGAAGLLIGLTAVAIQYQLFSTLYITYIWVFIGLLVAITSPKSRAA